MPYAPRAKPGKNSIQQRTRAALLANGWHDITASSRTGRYITLRLPVAISRPLPSPPLSAGSCLLLGKSGAVRLTPDGTLAHSVSIQDRAILAFILATPLPAAQSRATSASIEDLF
jgi:hypothetical protein